METIGRLSSGIAHDFNNLLTVVLSLADLAHGGLPPDHPVHEDLNRITEAGLQAAGLASQLLAFGKQQRTTGRRLGSAPGRAADVGFTWRRPAVGGANGRFLDER